MVNKPLNPVRFFSFAHILLKRFLMRGIRVWLISDLLFLLSSQWSGLLLEGDEDRLLNISQITYLEYILRYYIINSWPVTASLDYWVVFASSSIFILVDFLTFFPVYFLFYYLRYLVHPSKICMCFKFYHDFISLVWFPQCCFLFCFVFSSWNLF